MDTEQVLKVSVRAVNVWTGWEIFYGKMGRDGRIIIPKLQRELLRDREKSLVGYVMNVMLEPALDTEAKHVLRRKKRKMATKLQSDSNFEALAL